MADVIASDATLTETHRLMLASLSNMIVPPDPSRGMPGAADTDLISYLVEFGDEAIDLIKTELDSLDELAKTRHRSGFADLDQASRDALVAEMKASDAVFLQNTVVQVLSCYYQDERVVEALGVESTPPFPDGNTVIDGDLSLLDPVRARAEVYRRRMNRK